MKFRVDQVLFLWPEAGKTLIMTTEHQISYVNKVPRADIHNAIRFVGGKNPDGTFWRLNLNTAVQKVLDATYRFYVFRDGNFARVSVARSASGHLYLKTEADSSYVNNLLSLPEFP
jgi:hypothetical protein